MNPSVSTDQTLAEAIDSVLPEITALRHELHQHPEIRFEEHWTSDRVAQFLDETGIPYTRGHAKGTGIVARIEGTGDRTVGLRSDMDALEIHEETGLDYASTIPERMHACGHDGHMANLCGVAKVLQARRNTLKGVVKLIFQPAEEIAAGGRYIVEEGILDDVEAVFALHGWPTLPVGAIGLKAGPAMASADVFTVKVNGRGSHAADPGAGVDPIVVASHITTAFQSIVSREINPWDPAVVTVARIEAGKASNVIPESAEMEGTFRALRPKVRARLRNAITRIAEQTALAHRATADVSFSEDTYPPLVNHEPTCDFVREVIADTFAPSTLNELKHPSMAAEDFAYYLEKVPGVFLFLGVNPSATEPYPNLHSPRYDFTDTALPTGIRLLSELAIRQLSRTSQAY